MEGESDLEGFLTLVSSLEAGPTLASLSDLSMEVHHASAAEGDAQERETVSFRFTVEGYTLVAPARPAPAPVAGDEVQ